MRLCGDAPEYTVWAGTGCFDMLMGAWMGRWARIKGAQDPRGTGGRMLVGSQGSGDENGSLENFHRHTHVLPVSQGADVKSWNFLENYRVPGVFLLPKWAGARVLAYGL